MTLLSTQHAYIMETEEVKVVQRKGGFSVLTPVLTVQDFQISTAYFIQNFSVIVVVSVKRQSAVVQNYIKILLAIYMYFETIRNQQNWQQRNDALSSPLFENVQPKAAMDLTNKTVLLYVPVQVVQNEQFSQSFLQYW